MDDSPKDPKIAGLPILITSRGAARMNTKRSAAMFAFFLTAFLFVTTAWSQDDESMSAQAETPEQDLLPTEVSLLRDLHFSGPDGADVLVPPGVYLVELASTSGLRLSPRDGDPVDVLARQTGHEEQVDGALALGEETEADQFHVVLLLPDGIAHDAVASYSGIVTRDTTQRVLDASQISVARRDIRRQPISSIGVATVAAPLPSLDRTVAPWLNIVADKKAYYVYPQFTVPAAREQIRRPITDERYRQFVQSRGAAFRVAGRALPLAVNANAIVDVGGGTLDRSNTAALIDLGRSPAFSTMLKESIGVNQRDPYYVTAFLVNSLAFDLPATQQSGQEKYRHDERVLVEVAAKDHRSTALWVLENGKWTKLFNVQRPRSAIRDPRRELLRLKTAQQPKFYQGYERVDLNESQASGAREQIFGRRELTNLTEIRCSLSGCVEKTRLEPMTSATMEETPDSSQSEGFYCGEGGCEPANAGSSSQPSDSSDTGDTGDTSVPEPPKSYSSWGNPRNFTTWAQCNRRCSSGNCVNCCTNQMVIEQGVIAHAAMWCHFFSDLCPWCHIGCATATVMAQIPLLTLSQICIGNCLFGYEEYGANPHHCPVH